MEGTEGRKGREGEGMDGREREDYDGDWRHSTENNVIKHYITLCNFI